jgi:PAS domain S-box-containing protein
VIGFVHDISARKRAEATLAESESRYRNIFDASPVAIWEEDFSAVRERFEELRRLGVTDFRAYFDRNPDEVPSLAARVRILEINRQSVELLGAADAAQVARELTGYFTAESMEVFKEEMIALANGATRFQSEIPILNAAGQPAILDLGLAVQPGCERTLSRVLVSFLDITRRKSAEAALQKSEEKFRRLAETAPIGVYLTDENGKCTFVNTRWSEMAGLSSERAAGDGWIQGLHRDDRDRVAEAWDRMVRSGGRWGLEYRFQTPDGKVTWVYGLAAPVRDAAGRLTAYVGTNTDITQLQQAQEAVRSTDRRFRTVADFTYDWEYWIRPDGELEYVSPSCQRVTGYSAEQLRATPGVIDAMVLAEDRKAWEGHRGCRAEEGPTSLTIRIRRSDGGVRWIEHVWQPVTGDGGEPLGRRVSVRDVSERRAA